MAKHVSRFQKQGYFTPAPPKVKIHTRLVQSTFIIDWESLTNDLVDTTKVHYNRRYYALDYHTAYRMAFRSWASEAFPGMIRSGFYSNEFTVVHDESINAEFTLMMSSVVPEPRLGLDVPPLNKYIRYVETNARIG